MDSEDLNVIIYEKLAPDRKDGQTSIKLLEADPIQTLELFVDSVLQLRG